MEKRPVKNFTNFLIFNRIPGPVDVSGKTIIIWDTEVARDYLKIKFSNENIQMVFDQLTRNEIYALRDVGFLVGHLLETGRYNDLKINFNKIYRRAAKLDRKEYAAFFIEMLAELSLQFRTDFLQELKNFTKKDLEETKKFKQDLEKTKFKISQIFKPYLKPDELLALQKKIDESSELAFSRIEKHTAWASESSTAPPVEKRILEDRAGKKRIKKIVPETEAAKDIGMFLLLVGYDKISVISRFVNNILESIIITPPTLDAIRRQITDIRKKSTEQIKSHLEKQYPDRTVQSL